MALPTSEAEAVGCQRAVRIILLHFSLRSSFFIAPGSRHCSSSLLHLAAYSLETHTTQHATMTTTTAHEAAAIQQSLARTQTLLQHELGRVSAVSHVIDQDGQLLGDTKETHASLNVRNASQALKNLQQAQQREERILWASIVFFVLVLGHILWVRVISHLPLVERVLLWMSFVPRRLLTAVLDGSLWTRRVGSMQGLGEAVESALKSLQAIFMKGGSDQEL